MQALLMNGEIILNQNTTKAMKTKWIIFLLAINTLTLACTKTDYSVLRKVTFENTTTTHIQLTLQGNIIEIAATPNSSIGDYEWSPFLLNDTSRTISIDPESSTVIFVESMGSTNKVAPDIVPQKEIGDMIGWKECLGDSMSIQLGATKTIKYKRSNLIGKYSPYNGFNYSVERTGDLEFNLTYTFLDEHTK